MLSGLSENLSFLISLVPQARGWIHSEDEDRKKEMHVRFVHFELLSKKSMLTHYLCCFSLLAEAGLCAIKETGRCNHAQYKTYCLWYEEAEELPRKTDLAILCKYPHVLQSHRQIDAVCWKERVGAAFYAVREFIRVASMTAVCAHPQCAAGNLA